MRTTVTLDDDTEQIVRARMKARHVSFKQALNDAIQKFSDMIKLLRLFLLVAFLFASSPSNCGLVVNSEGNLQLVSISRAPKAVNVEFAPTIFVVEANCNSPPASI